jgi:two-component sensor histidine kinase
MRQHMGREISAGHVCYAGPPPIGREEVAVQTSNLTAQNAYLTEMLKQAGLDAEAQIVAARIQTVLTDEIHHRMKNMLAMVTAIVRQSIPSAPDLAHAEEAISTRLIAMAKAQDLLLKAARRRAGLIAIVADAIDQHNSRDRIILEGDDIEVISSSILPLTMILNELCTNATKYGALSNDSGKIRIAWQLENGRLTFSWRESGGPRVVKPAQEGFGTLVTGELLVSALSAQIERDYGPNGLSWSLRCPARVVIEAEQDKA